MMDVDKFSYCHSQTQAKGKPELLSAVDAAFKNTQEQPDVGKGLGLLLPIRRMCLEK